MSLTNLFHLRGHGAAGTGGNGAIGRGIITGTTIVLAGRYSIR
jgi:hypothetical protein